jgi:hypothetical protein
VGEIDQANLSYEAFRSALLSEVVRYASFASLPSKTRALGGADRLLISIPDGVTGVTIK